MPSHYGKHKPKSKGKDGSKLIPVKGRPGVYFEDLTGYQGKYAKKPKPGNSVNV